ncbi:hypothetical protein [Erwinia phage Pecta]|nr:hypothetical protein [Erwinia phage Pecta]
MFIKIGRHIVRLSTIVRVSKTVRLTAEARTVTTTLIHLRDGSALQVNEELDKVQEMLNAASRT